jgi:Ion channel
MLLEDWSPLDSLYFSVVTLATVGFGDLHPTTDPAKLFTIFYIIAGLGILAAFVSELTKIRYSRLAARRPGADEPPEAGPTDDA